MKWILSILFLFFSTYCFSQNKVISTSENSARFTGKINGVPITLFIKKTEIIYCDRYDTYLEGWYYYNKYKIKIPLCGYANGCNLLLFHYGKNHNAISKKILKNASLQNLDSVFTQPNLTETISFNRCNSAKKTGLWQGNIKIKQHNFTITLHTSSTFFVTEKEWFTLPNHKTINLREIFTGYGGNSFYSLKQTKNQNRLLLYFESISNHNACGLCGASEGEKGYRIIYFNKNWTILSTQEVLIESCLKNIYDSKIVSQNNAAITYRIKNATGEAKYDIKVDKQQALLLKIPITNP